MNNIIEIILNYWLIWFFIDQFLIVEEIDILVKSVQVVFMFSYVQVYLIIGVFDFEKKCELFVFVGNQFYVENNGYFFVFCVDLYCY